MIFFLSGMIHECLSKPFTIPPAILSTLFKNLHTLNCNYGQQYSEVFARYVPNVLPPMKETELPSYIEETRQLQEQLRGAEGFASGNPNLKRRGDDENYGPQYGVVPSESSSLPGGISWVSSGLMSSVFMAHILLNMFHFTSMAHVVYNCFPGYRNK